jgi:hypothetical protein
VWSVRGHPVQSLACAERFAAPLALANCIPPARACVCVHVHVHVHVHACVHWSVLALHACAGQTTSTTYWGPRTRSRPGGSMM